MSSIQVSVKYEQGRAYRGSLLEYMANAACLALQSNPLMADKHPLYEASKATDWFAGNGVLPDNENPATENNEKVRRLRAIEYGTETLLEHSYRADGRLAATWYHGNKVVHYDWDDLSGTRRMRYRDGSEIVIASRGNQAPEYILYDNRHRFQYDYDLNGNTTKVVYPDAAQVKRVFEHNQLMLANCDLFKTEFAWEPNGLAGYTLDGNGARFEFRSDTKRHECDFDRTPVFANGLPASLVHSLGAWRFSRQGVLDEMWTPWGDRFCVRASGENGPTIIWTPSGQRRFEYNQDGTLASTTDSRGLHTVYYRPKNTTKALVINAKGVASHDYDQQGRLRKSLDQTGYYTLFDYSRDGTLKQIADFLETIKLNSRNGSRADSVNNSGGYNCNFGYGSDGSLKRLTAAGLRRNTASETHRMLSFLWAWLSSQPTEVFAVSAK